MTWRWWWSDETEHAALAPEPHAERDPQPVPAGDPLKSLQQHTGPGLRARTARWLQRVYGNQRVQCIVESLRGGGRPLDPTTRQHLEATFGQDLRDVRVHDESEAQAAAAELGARAFTDGRDIYLGPSEQSAPSPQDHRLVAHEVAHTIQQSGGSTFATDRAVMSGDEPAARAAAERAVQGTPLDIALGPAVSTQPAMQDSNWGDDVRAAQGHRDEAARAAALQALIQRALGPNQTVHRAGTTHPTQAHPDDYQPFPAINFDVRLNSKTSSSARGAGYSLNSNYGYSFSHNGIRYSVLGPRALDPSSPVLTRMYAEHELYLARQWLNRPGPVDPNRNNQELDLWVHDFVGFFHQVIGMGLQWAPMLQYYEGADPQPRQAALQRLCDYYAHPPVAAADVARVQRAFAQWLRRRLHDHAAMQLVQDLENRLHLGASGSSQPHP